MKVGELCQKLEGKLLCGGEETQISGWYAGDLLSHVMGKLPPNAAWFTIMNNANVAAVASLAEAACVVLCEGVTPDAGLSTRAATQGITLISTPLPVYEAIAASLS